MTTQTNPTSLVEDGLVTVDQARRFLGIGRTAVYELMERGQLPYVKFAKSRRIPRRALVELARNHLVVAGTPADG